MSAKIKKRETIQSLDTLTHWLNNSSFDYSYDDFKLLLDEIDMSYKAYLFELRKIKDLEQIKDNQNG